MTKVTRTIPTSTINFCRMAVKDGKAVPSDPEKLEIVGDEVKMADAAKRVKAKLGEAAEVFVISVDVRQDLYAMELPAFIAGAVKIEKPAAPVTGTSSSPEPQAAN